ncbi:hypothetical protein E8E14_012011 [Neopestalotiopsis sp. 37M]|nr:hypothetical protein E8E14_012011 [Neopestalotiopsis sp. 37M]
MRTFSRLLGQSLVAACGLASAVSAGVLRSRLPKGVQIEYNEPNICETTPGVKSYSGYLTLNSTSLQDYPQKLFFWFFEARNDPENAPMSIWLQGGPGAPSIDQALNENGPCQVQSDSNSTVLNPYSWNNYVNMLYIDQPVQTGYSYDVATPGVIDGQTADIYPNDTWTGPLNVTAVEGVFASQDMARTVPTTAVAAEAIWEFLQLWMSEFEQYQRDSISIWSQSYGGHYAPAIAHLLHTRSQSCSADELKIDVETVGIISGFLDFAVHAASYPGFALNNTYGIQAYPLEVAESAAANFSAPGGCRDLIDECHALTPNGYHDQYGANETVTEACGTAFLFCWTYVYFAYDALSGRDPFDIGHFTPISFPPPYVYGYLNQEWVMEALGAEVNYTSNSNPTQNAFFGVGDFVFDGFTDDLAQLLDDGIRASLINGDRDFRCNWVAGEQISLEIDYSNKDDFAAAGYAEIVTNDEYIGGFVRQYDGFSYSRVFEAGHHVNSDQPETAYQLFMRTIFGKDLATGSTDVTTTAAADSYYSTQGPASVFNVTNEPPLDPGSECFVLIYPFTGSCTDEQIAALYDGSAVIENNVVVSPAGRPAQVLNSTTLARF